MATSKTNNRTNSKKTENSQKSWASSLLGFLRRRWWVVLLVGLLVLGVSSFAYEKYLDRQNVADMKQLLADFEKIKTDVESETGEKLFIESSCDSVGKFSESYGCYLYLKNKNNKLLNYEQSVQTGSSLKNPMNRCRVIDGEGAKYLNFYSCTVRVRSSNIDSANRIFN